MKKSEQKEDAQLELQYPCVVCGLVVHLGVDGYEIKILSKCYMLDIYGKPYVYTVTDIPVGVHNRCAGQSQYDRRRGERRGSCSVHEIWSESERSWVPMPDAKDNEDGPA